MKSLGLVRRLRRPWHLAWIVLPVAWLVLGSTFVAIKVGVTAALPFFFSGTRFVVVGAVLLCWEGWRSGWRLDMTRREVAIAAATGFAFITIGQGSLTWSSRFLTPGLVAVLISTMPLWAAVLGRLLFGTHVARMGQLGLVAGFAGVAFLAWPRGGSGIALGPALLVVAGAVAWAISVLVTSRSGILRKVVLTSAIQLLVGGGLQLVIGLVSGEGRELAGDQVLASLPALLYLIAVPSLIGFPLFNWLLSKLPVHVANTVAYVQPLVALVLGWLLLHEAVTQQTIVGMAVILTGVALMVFSARPTTAGVDIGKQRTTVKLSGKALEV